MFVFDDRVRTDPSVSKHNEPKFAFLNRVSGDYWGQVRMLIEEWVGRFPAAARSDLVGRLQTSDRGFIAAFWELYLYETFVRGGFDVEVHPAVSTGSRVPDFLVSRGEEAFYVEAKCLFEGELDSGAEARRDRLYDSLNDLRSPNFFLSVECHEVGPQEISARQLRRELEEWLGRLDPDKASALAFDEDGGERLQWVAEGWLLEFRPIPVQAEYRGRPDHRPIGMVGPGEVRLIDDAGALRKALGKKGSAYGNLAYPLVLAINVERAFHDDEDSLSALFGTSQISFPRGDPAAARATRGSDGYWLGPNGWRRTNVAGVLVAQAVAPWLVAKVVPTLWLHPGASPLKPLLLWRTAWVDGDRVRYIDQPSDPADYFGLADPWPVGESFPKGVPT